MLNTLLAISNYSRFIMLGQKGELLLPSTVFLYLVIILVLLSIVTINVMIGLAVSKTKNAAISRREVEI